MVAPRGHHMRCVGCRDYHGLARYHAYAKLPGDEGGAVRVVEAASLKTGRYLVLFRRRYFSHYLSLFRMAILTQMRSGHLH